MEGPLANSQQQPEDSAQEDEPIIRVRLMLCQAQPLSCPAPHQEENACKRNPSKSGYCPHEGQAENLLFSDSDLGLRVIIPPNEKGALLSTPGSSKERQ